MMGGIPPSPGETALEGLLRLIADPDAVKKQVTDLKKMRDEASAKMVESAKKLKEIDEAKAKLADEARAHQHAVEAHAKAIVADDAAAAKKQLKLDKQAADQAQMKIDQDRREKDLAKREHDMGQRELDATRREEQWRGAQADMEAKQKALDAKIAKAKEIAAMA